MSLDQKNEKLKKKYKTQFLINQMSKDKIRKKNKSHKIIIKRMRVKIKIKIN